jgi:hypothetical protein
MTIIWHIVRKDLRRLRWWLVGWAGMLALPILLGVRIATGEPMSDEDWRALRGTVESLTMLELGMAYLLVILSIAEDGPVGSNQFWLTRPAGGRKVATAKFITAVLIVFVLPCLVMLPWWLWSGFGVVEVRHAALEIAVLGFLIGVPAALIATQTDSIPRALLWSLVMAAVGMTMFPVFITISTGPEEAAMRATRLIVAVAIFWLHALLAAAVQYGIRNRLRTAQLAVSAVAVLLLAQFSMTLWPKLWLGPEELVEKDAAKAAGVTVEVQQATRSPGPRTAPNVERWDSIEVTYAASGIPAGLKLLGDNARQQWRWDNLAIERLRHLYAVGPGDMFGLGPGRTDPETEQWRRERWRQEHPNNPDGYPTFRHPEKWTLGLSAPVPRSIAQRMVTEAPQFEAKLWMQLVRPTLRYEMPLRVAQRAAGNGSSTRVARIDHVAQISPSSNPYLWLMETKPFRFGDHLRWELNRIYRYHLGWTETRYVLLNRQQREVFDIGYALNEPGITVHGVTLSWRSVPLRGGGFAVVRNGRWVERPGWADGATLALVAKEPEALFARDVRVERLTVKETARHPTLP